jgi:hypothetical protein
MVEVTSNEYVGMIGQILASALPNDHHRNIYESGVAEGAVA